MLERCKKDVSLGLEARRVPVLPRALDKGSAVTPYPLFAYCVRSPGNPVVRTSVCCQCPGNCRTNPHCACRQRYHGDVPLRPNSERLTEAQLTDKKVSNT